MVANPPTPYDIVNDNPVYLSKEDKYVYNKCFSFIIRYLPEYDQCVSLQDQGTSYHSFVLFYIAT